VVLLKRASPPLAVLFFIIDNADEIAWNLASLLCRRC